MAIDLNKLLGATQGDPEAKITVKRSWLTEVYRLLREGERAKEELARIKARLAAVEDMADDLEDTKGSIFGKGGAFDKMFGNKRGF